MITKSNEGTKKQVGDIEFEVLAHGEKAMVTRFEFAAGGSVPAHAHPHTQCGYVAAGSGKFTVAGEEHQVGEGDSYYIPGGTEHGFVAAEKSVLVDFFTPPREEYL